MEAPSLPPEPQDQWSASSTEPGTPKAGDFSRLGDLLAPAATRPARGAQLAASSSADKIADVGRLIALFWPEVVGPEIAANARPTCLRNGRLVVATSSPAWAQSLHLLSEHLLHRLQERLAQAQVRAEITKLMFRHAGWDSIPGQSPHPQDQAAGATAQPTEQAHSSETKLTQALSPEQESALAEVEKMSLPSALKDALLRAMRASFVRGGKDFVR